MFGTPRDIEAAMRREESTALELLNLRVCCEDLRTQLMALVEMYAERTGASREEINVKIAQRRAQMRKQDEEIRL